MHKVHRRHDPKFIENFILLLAIHRLERDAKLLKPAGVKATCKTRMNTTIDPKEGEEEVTGEEKTGTEENIEAGEEGEEGAEGGDATE